MTTPDLFPVEFPGFSTNEPRRPTEKASGVLKSPKVKPRNPGSRESRARSPETPGKPSGGLGLLQDIRAARRIPDLLAERSSLENDIEAALPEYEAAHAEQQPYRDEFNAAHQWLIELHSRRQSVAHEAVMAAYDRRLFAGQAWHPYRTKADDLSRYLKRLRDALKAVNAEIGV